MCIYYQRLTLLFLYSHTLNLCIKVYLQHLIIKCYPFKETEMITTDILTNSISKELLETEKGDLIQISRIKDKKHRTAPYFCIGRKGTTNFFDPLMQHKVYTEGLDVTSIFIKLNPITLSLFWKLAALRDPRTNTVNLLHQDLNPTDKNRLKKHSAELFEHQLICRIKRGYILINPKAIIPEYSFYESVENRWNQLALEKNQAKKDSQPTEVLDENLDIHHLKLKLPAAGVMDSPIDDEEITVQKPPINRTFTL